MKKIALLLISVGISLLIACSKEELAWEQVQAEGEPTARHEAGLVAFDDKIYLLGGRRVNPTDVFDPKSLSWAEKAKPPIEIHHFQAVVVEDAIYILGAMTGRWPREAPLDRVLKYFPETDEWVYGDTIPEHRRRGGAGAVYHNGKIYLVGGITNGHMNGSKSWFDAYDPKTGEWTVLDDAPHARDHFQAVVADNKLYAFAGRRSSRATKQDMSLTVEHGNVFDFESGRWQEVRQNLSIPTQRAGNSAVVWNDLIIVGGGESAHQKLAHNAVEVFSPKEGAWRRWPGFIEGRHGSGIVEVDGYLYTISGSGNRGGAPELKTIERLRLPKKVPKAELVYAQTGQNPEAVVYKQWHTINLQFKGPESSETDKDNPFLNYRLRVDFKNGETAYSVRGFYAADGQSLSSGAERGDVWQVRFTPPTLGEWQYEARLEKGENIAVGDKEGETVPIENSRGYFRVIPSDKEGKDFRAHGRLIAQNGLFYFPHTQRYWLKGGANSPENFLGYLGIDGTYRVSSHKHADETSITSDLHRFEAHEKDWRLGDPVFRNGEGKSLFGAINYLESTGMNAIYFLSMNIKGDGQDVWPYLHHEEFTRFDVSRLEQWEQIFQYMQSKGILLHVVTQETENETLLDNGEVGLYRELYYRELIARFGHHLGLVWNLGEENGPADWSPIAQNDKQRKAMASFFQDNDPYDHPVLLHTHADIKGRKPVLEALLGFKDLDGLSLQVDHRERAAAVIEEWRQKSIEAGHQWLIGMDEIGLWHTAVLPDRQDPGHPTLRGQVLWGSLMSGAAGIEWYFGGKHPHNDLTSEDWRERAQMWRLTDNALTFFNRYLPWWDMQPQHDLLSVERMPNEGEERSFCFAKQGQVYAVYLAKHSINAVIDLTMVTGEYSVQWYNPVEGGELQLGSIQSVKGGEKRSIGLPPSRDHDDWVVFIKRQD